MCNTLILYTMWHKSGKLPSRTDDQRLTLFATDQGYRNCHDLNSVKENAGVEVEGKT